MPASRAAEWAEERGYPINLKCLTQDAPKHGVRIRPQELPGRHKQEVELNSLARYLLERGRPETESDQEAIQRTVREAQEQKRKERSLD
jgi:hypothetical protein